MGRHSTTTDRDGRGVSSQAPPSLLGSLNEQQKMAATTSSAHTLVRAGAGTGKTATIIARCAYLIESGVSPESIYALTFTRRSAAEIRDRVEAILGTKAHGLSASTFHSWCMRLLRGNEELWGYAGWTVIDADDQKTLFKSARGKRPPLFPTAKDIQSAYSFARNVKRPLSEVAADKFGVDAEQARTDLGPIVREYERQKELGRYLDYDDILAIVGQQLQRSDELAAWVGQYVHHLLIDEMQDTNPLQWDIIRPLVKHLSLYCVGDDAQSIYGFRGADFKSIHHFDQVVPGAQILSLTINYRSTQGVLDLSNWLLGESTLEYDKRLVAARPDTSTPEVADFRSEGAAANWICDQIEASLEEHERLKDTLILSRTNWGARFMEQALLRRNIPYRFYGGQKLLETAHIRDVLAALRVVANPYDNLAWLRLLMLYPTVGEVTATKTLEIQLAHYPENACFDYAALPRAAAELLREMSGAANDVPAALEIAIEHLQPVLEKKYQNQNWGRRQPDLRLLLELAEGHSSIAGFVEQYLLDPISTTELTGEPTLDAVSVATIHSAKGMEANNVFILNAGPGQFPWARAENDDDVEEERRVLYVALTRAKNRLVLTRLARSGFVDSYSGEKSNEMLESYFFAEVPDSLWNQVELPVIAQPLPPAHINLPKVDLSVDI